MLSRFYLDDGSVSWCAAVEQMVLNYGIYFEGTDWVHSTVKAAYGENDQVVAQQREPAAFGGGSNAMPRWVAIEHDSQLWVVIMGTRPVYQWVQNFLSLPTSLITSASCRAGHRTWNELAAEIHTKLLPWMEANPTGTVNISGHSLGGVLAWLLGVKTRNLEATQALRVNVITFASPRQSIGQWGDSATCKAPHFVCNVQTVDDIVTVLPPNVLPVIPSWTQNGQVNVVKSDGSLADDDTNAVLNYLPLTRDRFRRHYPGTYQNTLLARLAWGRAEGLFTDCVNTDKLLRAANLADEQPEVTPVLPSPPKAIDGYSVADTTLAFKPFFFREVTPWH